MTHDEKIEYMKIAAGVVGFNFKHEHLDFIVSLYELLLEQKGKTNIENISKIADEVHHRAEMKKNQELLNKVSEKID